MEKEAEVGARPSRSMLSSRHILTRISSNAFTSHLCNRSIWISSSDPSKDTIFAAATPIHTKSALSIVRVDGPKAASLYHRMTRPTHATAGCMPSMSNTLPQARLAKLRKIFCPHTQEILDPEAIVINFPHSPRSTSTLEFHLHGSQAIIKSVTSALSRLEGFRIARAGEFTQRRYERSQSGGGGMHINQILALKNLIDAETDEQRKLAIHQFDVHTTALFFLLSCLISMQSRPISCVVEHAAQPRELMLLCRYNMMARDDFKKFIETYGKMS